MTTLSIVTFYLIVVAFILFGFIAGWMYGGYRQKRKHNGN